MLLHTNCIFRERLNNARAILLNALTLSIQFKHPVITIYPIEHIISIKICKIGHYYGKWITYFRFFIFLLQIVHSILVLNLNCPFCEGLIGYMVHKYIFGYNIIIWAVHSNILDLHKLVIIIINQLCSLWVHVVGTVINCDTLWNRIVHYKPSKSVNKIILRGIKCMRVQLS